MWEASAQNGIKVAGTVMDENGLELSGVSVTLKGNEQIGTTTDADGRFRLEQLPAGATLIFRYIGFETLEALYTTTKERERIVLVLQVSEFDEVVVTGQGTQRKISVVGAIATIDPKELQVPGVSVTNMMGGRIPGIISVTRSGEPGSNFSDFWIRGISTFGARQGALVLIDGIEGNLNDLDPADIQDFSVLKDASATAVYGVRGANGVVIVNTKQGKAGRPHVQFKTNATYSYSPRMPEYAEAYDYALLANEARAVRGAEPIYTPTEVELFRTQLDPDLYPNVNWREVILKDHVVNNQHNLNVSGGGATSRYFLSLGLLNSEALFKQEPSRTDRVNVDYHKYNFRGNVNSNLTPKTELSLNLETVFITQNAPGDGSDNRALWAAQANLPPTMVPVRYSNGQLPTFGRNADEMSPYVRLNYTGYNEFERYSAKAILNLRQNLDALAKGLSARAMFALSTNGSHRTTRTMNPDLFYADPRNGRNLDGSLRTFRRMDKQNLSVWREFFADRRYYFESVLNYNRSFGGDHSLTGLLRFDLDEAKYSGRDHTLFEVIPVRYSGLSGRATYGYRDTYFLEGNIGYTGSENFSADRRFGWFPSAGLGWIPSQYRFFSEHFGFVNFLKIRASHGQTGNDRLNTRFPYLTLIGGSGTGTWGGAGLAESQIGAPDMEWETTTKSNLGIDAKFWENRFDLSVNFFRERTTGIFQRRANIPEEAGLTSVLPFANIGAMRTWGTDGTLAFTHNIRPEMSFTLRGNFTLARNNVEYWEQSGINFPYQSFVNVPIYAMRGLIAEGLFRDEDDIRSSPRQQYMGEVLPGDIKYRDVNGDGVVNNDDIVPLSHANIPNVHYGFAASFSYGRLGISAFFEGIGEVQYFLGGTGYHPFAWESRGNLLTIATDPKNRWIPMDYALANGIDPALAENPNARFPRLTYGNNANNVQPSTFWLANGKYLRLRNVQVDYRLPERWLARARIRSATLSLVGDNLHVWDSVKLWDPGQASANGSVYPLQRMFTAQLVATF